MKKIKKRIAWILCLFSLYPECFILFVFRRVLCSHHPHKGSEKALAHLFTLKCNWLVALSGKYHESLFCSGLVIMSCLTLCDPVDCSRQAPLSMGFSKQEYWSGLPFFPPWDLPSPGIEPESPALQADSWLRNVQMTVQSTYLLGWTWQKEARLLEISFLKEQKVDLLELKPMNRQHVLIKLKTILRCYLQ